MFIISSRPEHGQLLLPNIYKMGVSPYYVELLLIGIPT